MAGGNFFKPPVGDAQANFRYGLACGAEAERERIIALLEARRYDLASCLKDDDCAVRADAIEVCISDIKGEKE